MPAAKSRTRSKPATKADTLIVGPTDGPLYMASEHLAALGVPQERAAEVLADGALAHRWLADRVGWYSRPELVALANAAWGERAVDRLNAALDFLAKAGRAVRV